MDSAPLQRKYLTSAELWLLEHVEPVFRLYPWKTLLRSGAKGNAVTPYGQHRRWAKQEGLPLHWIENAGHCANLDAPDEVNDLVRSFVTACST